MQIRQLILGCAGAVLFAAHATSAAEPAQSDASTANNGGGYHLAAGDRLSVRIFEEDQLTGAYAIDVAGTITLPIVGAIKVGGLTLEAAQTAVQQQLSKGFYKNPVVSIRVEEYRPIYVHGNVKSPGVYSFRTGLVAIGAAAMAGGSALQPILTAVAAGDLVSADERVAVQSAKKGEMHVRVAMLEAMRDRADLKIDAIPEDFRARANFDDLVRGANRQIETERRALTNELDVLERERPQFDAEQVAIDNEIETQLGLLKLSDERVFNFKDLAKKGMANSKMLLEPQQQSALVQSTIARLKSAKARNNIERTALELKTVEKQNGFEQRVQQQLSDARIQLAEVGILLAAAQKMQTLRRQTTGLQGKAPAAQSFVILRTSSDKQETLVATAASPVEPGDIIEVRSFDDEVVGGIAPAQDGSWTRQFGSADTPLPASPASKIAATAADVPSAMIVVPASASPASAPVVLPSAKVPETIVPEAETGAGPRVLAPLEKRSMAIAPATAAVPTTAAVPVTADVKIRPAAKPMQPDLAPATVAPADLGLPASNRPAPGRAGLVRESDLAYRRRRSRIDYSSKRSRWSPV